MIHYYVVRHGKKEYEPFDPALTTEGKHQAELTANALKHIPFSHIYSSPKKRTLETAEIIAKYHHKPIIKDTRLLERMEWQKNETFDEFSAEWIKTQQQTSYTPATGLSSQSNGRQMKQFLHDISKNHYEASILIITHGGTIGDLLRMLFTEQQLDIKKEPQFGSPYIEISECSITIIKKELENYTLTTIGDIAHLHTKYHE